MKRRWHEIVRFHEALVNELAYDKALDCFRVKAKIPTLPSKADLDTWTHSYAATGDACALSRTKKLDPPTAVAQKGLARHVQAPMDDLEGLHWIYVELRLVPYFREVNNILRELTTSALAGSAALRRFAVPGSCGAMQKAPHNSNGVPRRFLGSMEPACSHPDDIDAASRHMRRTNPEALISMPSLLRKKLPALAGSKSSTSLAKLAASGAATSVAEEIRKRRDGNAAVVDGKNS